MNKGPLDAGGPGLQDGSPCPCQPEGQGRCEPCWRWQALWNHAIQENNTGALGEATMAYSGEGGEEVWLGSGGLWGEGLGRQGARIAGTCWPTLHLRIMTTTESTVNPLIWGLCCRVCGEVRSAWQDSHEDKL